MSTPSKLMTDEETTKLVAHVATECALKGNWLDSNQEKVCEQLGLAHERIKTLEQLVAHHDEVMDKAVKWEAWRLARIKTLEAALEPFAEFFDDFDYEEASDNERIEVWMEAGWFRRAAAALKGEG